MTGGKLQPLPLGTSTFSELRRDGQIYVDKTDLVCRMAMTRGKFFLARPRRFGKSLLVSTFRSLFQDGLKHFGGLAAERLWKDRTYTVIHLSFAEASSPDLDLERFRRRFISACLKGFRPAGFEYHPESCLGITEQLSCWMAGLPGTSIVLLIDEYDAPLTASMGTDQFRKIRADLSDFFQMVKENEGCLRFFFMTGITKFQNAGIFSAFNSLKDISLKSAYSTLLGYTEGELLHYFSGWLDNAAARAGYPDRDSLVSAMRRMYDGFCFDRKASAHVYAPWSVLNFLDSPEEGLIDYWYGSSGQPSLLMTYLSSHGMDRPEDYASEKTVSISQLESSQDVDSLDINALLVQAGYLTIKSVSADGRTARLGYPNQEVGEAMARLYADRMTGGPSNSAGITNRIIEALSAGDPGRLAEAFNGLLLCLDSREHPGSRESALRAVIQVVLISRGLKPRIEVHNALGKSDIEAVSGRYHWVLELKVARSASEIQAKLREGIDQVKDRRYGLAQPEGELLRAVMVCSAEERRFAAWQMVDGPVPGLGS